MSSTVWLKGDLLCDVKVEPGTWGPCWARRHAGFESRPLGVLTVRSILELPFARGPILCSRPGPCSGVLACWKGAVGVPPTPSRAEFAPYHPVLRGKGFLLLLGR